MNEDQQSDTVCGGAIRFPLPTFSLNEAQLEPSQNQHRTSFRARCRLKIVTNMTYFSLIAFRKFRVEEKSSGSRENAHFCNPKGIVSSSPGLRGNELPWVPAHSGSNPKGVVSPLRRRAATPLGLLTCNPVSQGSSCLATLGFEPESLRDS